jgi:hypothetical protein
MGDYHEEKKNKVFQGCFLKVLPILESQSATVMDKASVIA